MHQLETKLRALIGEIVFGEFLDDPERLSNAIDGVVEGLASKLRQRWKAHHDRAGYLSLTQEPLLEFLEMNEMAAIISARWNQFKPVFQNKGMFENALEVVRLARNAIAHNRKITGDLLATLREECGRLLDMMDGEQVGSCLIPAYEHGFLEALFEDRFGDVVSMYPSRSKFESEISYSDLITSSTTVDALGLSLNSLVLGYGSSAIEKKLFSSDSRFRLLFLDPNGQYIRHREAEEGYADQELVHLTRTNISISKKISEKGYEDKLRIMVYDLPIRYNIYIFNEEIAVIQFYGIARRGVDAPCVVVRKKATGVGMFEFARQNFDAIWELSYCYAPLKKRGLLQKLWKT